MTSSYVVSMFPYPSGDLHMGHAEVYSIGDAFARYQRLRGIEVLHPIGWDSFGLPAENAAFKRGLDPREWTYANIATQAESFRRLGISFDWRTRLHTSDPRYYHWNQWLFLRLFEKGLAYRKEAAVNWCPADKTVLANEQVIGGHCERCGATIVQRPLTQWFFRTTAYAQRLLDDMAQLEGGWPQEILAMQRHWIGRSAGAWIDFPVEGGEEPLRVFTTRPETLFGVTFLVVAADSPYTDGVGLFVVHPLSGERLPVFAADYVLAGHGTGVIMAVPAHDERDREFAILHGVRERRVIQDGTLVNSGEFDGLSEADGGRAIIARLKEIGAGEEAVTYRLHDWLLSRQRYWGTPIPIVHCVACGLVPVPDDQLPVRLPEAGYELRPAGGLSPLDSAVDWVRVSCPHCGDENARRDTDTMDTFVDSSWYFLRYPNPDYDEGPFDPAGVERWLPVDEYIGGKEHATGHLIYARFMTKVLHDLGMVPFVEPFTRLTNQGQVIMDGKAMSKTLANLVDLQEQIALYGPDAVRVTMLFAGPPEDDIDWADVSPTGSVKWLARVARLAGGLRPSTGEPDPELRKGIHRLIAETTTAMDGKRLNVAIASLMKLTNLLRRAAPDDPATREGVEALVCMLSCFAPFTAAETGLSRGAWPRADPALLTEQTVTCVVQVNGKVRERVEVPPDISSDELEELVLALPRFHDVPIRKVIVRPPALVSLVIQRPKIP